MFNFICLVYFVEETNQEIDWYKMKLHMQWTTLQPHHQEEDLKLKHKQEKDLGKVLDSKNYCSH
jgi:hypothetical protein